MSRESTTAEAVDAHLRRHALWARLLDLFRTARPGDEQLAQVATLAEVAMDQVCKSRRIDPQQATAQQETILAYGRDFAECAALYGYVLGYWQGRHEKLALDGARALTQEERDDGEHDHGC
jgi:hypothetical protein